MKIVLKDGKIAFDKGGAKRKPKSKSDEDSKEEVTAE